MSKHVRPRQIAEDLPSDAKPPRKLFRSDVRLIAILAVLAVVCFTLTPLAWNTPMVGPVVGMGLSFLIIIAGIVFYRFRFPVGEGGLLGRAISGERDERDRRIWDKSLALGSLFLLVMLIPLNLTAVFPYVVQVWIYRVTLTVFTSVIAFGWFHYNRRY